MKCVLADKNWAGTVLGTIQMLINLALVIGLKVSIHNHNEKGEIACMSGMLTMEGIALAEVGASLVAPEVVSQEGVEGLVNMGILTPGIASGFKDGLFTHGMGNLLGGQGGAGVAAKYLNDWHNRGTPDPQNPYGNQAWNGNRTMIFRTFDQEYFSDKKNEKLAEQLQNQKYDLSSWNHTTGEMVVLSQDPDETDPTYIHSFFPRCAGFVGGGIVDSEGNKFPYDYWTPNGTMRAPLGHKGYIDAEWMVEVGEKDVWDCRDRLPPGLLPTLKSHDAEHQYFIDLFNAKMAEKERKHHRVHARRLRRREELPFIFHAIRDHFSDLPAHGDAERHAAFVGEGTMMLLSGLAMNGTAPHQQAATLSHAMESVMDAHHNRKRSLTRFVRRSHVPADKLMHDLLDAMVEATDDQHKSWVRMIGQGALIGATRKNAHQYDEVSARAHQELIGKVTNSYWELSDDGLKLFA